MSTVQKVERPDHVPTGRVVDFDFYRDARYEPGDPHAGIAKLVAEAPPVFWTPQNGGHWVLAGHPELFEAVRNPEVFSNEKQGLPPTSYEPKQVPINSDPPEHEIYRLPLSKAFSPKAMVALQDDIRQLAVELIEKVRPEGRCDFATEIAEPLPVSIFMKLMGLPLEMLGEYRVWVNELLASGVPEVRGEALRKIGLGMSSIIKARMDQRRDDLISRLLDTEIDGRAVAFEEMQSYCLLLFIAGLDTVMNGMCFGIRHLAKDKALQAKLRADPALIPEAMEELLRRYTFTMPGRIVARDHEAFGVQFKKNERVLLMLPAADLDPREFENPLVFDLDRENKVHIAFNSGPHRCVGSHLARLELKILYQEMLSRIPTFSLDPERPAQTHGGHVIGFDSLGLVWDRS
jgi:cytochrome P450